MNTSKRKQIGRSVIVAQWVKLSLVLPASYLRVPIPVLATLLPIWFPINMPGKAANDVSLLPMWETCMKF